MAQPAQEVLDALLRKRRERKALAAQEQTPQEIVAPPTAAPARRILPRETLQRGPPTRPTPPPPPPELLLPETDPAQVEGLLRRRDERREAEAFAESGRRKGRLGTGLSGLVNAFVEIPTSAIEGLGAAVDPIVGAVVPPAVRLFDDEFADQLASPEAKAEISKGNPLRLLAESIRDNFQLSLNPEFADVVNPETERIDWANLLTTGVPSGIGSMGGFIATTVATRGGNLMIGGLGGLVNVAEVDRIAAENDAPAEKRIMANLAAFGVGVSEVFPLARMLNRMGGGRLTRATIQGIFEEGAQEFLQGVGNNAIMGGIVGLEQDLADSGVAAGTIIGGITGGIVSAALAALPGRRRGAGPAERAQATADGQEPPPAAGGVTGEPAAVARPAEEAVPAEAVIGAEPEEAAAAPTTPTIVPEELRPAVGERGAFIDDAGETVEGEILAIENEVAQVDPGTGQAVNQFIDRIIRAPEGTEGDFAARLEAEQAAAAAAAPPVQPGEEQVNLPLETPELTAAQQALTDFQADIAPGADTSPGSPIDQTIQQLRQNIIDLGGEALLPAEPAAAPEAAPPAEPTTPEAAPLAPEGEPTQPAPISPPTDRFSVDPGAIPGEPFATLDDGAAALIERVDDQGNSTFEAVAAGGQSIGIFNTPLEAGQAAEAFVDQGVPDVQPEPERPPPGEPTGLAETEREPGIEGQPPPAVPEPGPGVGPPGEPVGGEPAPTGIEAGEPAAEVGPTIEAPPVAEPIPVTRLLEFARTQVEAEPRPELRSILRNVITEFEAAPEDTAKRDALLGNLGLTSRVLNENQFATFDEFVQNAAEIREDVTARTTAAIETTRQQLEGLTATAAEGRNTIRNLLRKGTVTEPSILPGGQPTSIGRITEFPELSNLAFTKLRDAKGKIGLQGQLGLLAKLYDDAGPQFEDRATEFRARIARMTLEDVRKLTASDIKRNRARIQEEIKTEGEGPREPPTEEVPPAAPEAGPPPAPEGVPPTPPPAEPEAAPPAFDVERLQQVEARLVEGGAARTAVNAALRLIERGAPAPEIIAQLTQASNQALPQQAPLSEVIDEIVEAAQTAEDQRKAEQDRQAPRKVLEDGRSTILDTPAIVARLAVTTVADFPGEAANELAKWGRQETESARADEDDSRLQALDRMFDAQGRPNREFFDDLFYASLRVDVVRRADRTKRDKAKNAKARAKAGQKLGSTGESLRRFWEQLKGTAEGADTADADNFVKDITKATARADLFPVDRIGKGGTPGLRRFLATVIRRQITPFKQLQLGFSYQRSYEAMVERRLGDDEWFARQKVLATEYIDVVTRFAESLEGAGDIKAVQVLLDKALGKNREQQTDLAKDLVKVFDGSVVRKLRRYINPSQFEIERLIRDENKSDEEMGGTSAKPMRRPRIETRDLQREGLDDVRKGADITPVQLKDEFGFADITIGGYVTSGQEKIHLNKSFEAFADFAKLLGVDRKGMSLGGGLHFAIGALGHGRHAAHYAPTQPGPGGVGAVQVINVTNTKGDGTVAHEWGHALDFNTRDGLTGVKQGPEVDAIVKNLKSNMTLESFDRYTNMVNSFLDGGHYYPGRKREGVQAMAKEWLRRSIRRLEHRGSEFKTDYLNQAQKSGNVDYWASDEELFARAWEAWTFDSLDQQEAVNEYLVSDWVSDGNVTAPPYKFASYPQGDERAVFNNLFNQLRDGLEITDSGPQFKEGTLEKIDAPRLELIQRLTDLSDNMEAYAAEREAAKEDARLAEERERREKERREADKLKDDIADILGQKDTIADEIKNITDEQLSDLMDDVFADAEEGAQDQFADETQADQHQPDNNLADDTIQEDKIDSGQRRLADTMQDRYAVAAVNQEFAALQNNEFFALADVAFEGTRAEGAYESRDAYDALELAVNRSVREAIRSGVISYDNPTEAIEVLNRMTAALPTQRGRSKEQIEAQQFSTPPALAYAAAFAANVNADDMVLEPSAGVGALAIHGQTVGAHVTTNELSVRRQMLLEQIEPNAMFAMDGLDINNLKSDEKPSIVLMNPPFSAAVGTGAKNRTMRGARHVEAALKALRPGGRLVGIVGRGMARDAPSFRRWWSKIDRDYSVRAAIPMDGRLYRKFGTSFDNVLIVIDKTDAPEGRRRTVNSEVITRPIEQAEDLIPLLQEIRDGRPTLGEPTPHQRARRQGIEEGEPPAGPGPAPRGPTDPGIPPERAGRPGEPGAARTTARNAGRTRTNKPDQTDEISGPERRRNQRESEQTESTDRAAGRGPSLDPGTTSADVGNRSRVFVDENAERLKASMAKRGIKMSEKNLANIARLLGKKDIDPDEGVREDSAPYAQPFDAEIYKQLKPSLDEEYANAVIDGKSLREFAAGIAEGTSEFSRPYLEQWVKEQRAEAATEAAPQPEPEPAQEGAVKAEPDEPLELTDDVYERYQPTLTLPGAQEHPAELAETAALGDVTPPETDYQVELPQELIDSGAISDAQLEPIIMAGAAHQQLLPPATGDAELRRGILIGDGTGLGKTREILGIVLDNIAKGRNKVIYVSKNQDLINDLAENWSEDAPKGLGQDKRLILALNKTSVQQTPKAKRGIMFTTYSTLGRSLAAQRKGATTEFTVGRAVELAADAGRFRAGKIGVVARTSNTQRISVKFRGETKPVSVPRTLLRTIGPRTEVERTRTQQLVDWVGKDFDGVIVFDEAHLMSNAIEIRGARGASQASDQALAGIELANQLPNARVVYSTATAATEVTNLAYMDRLGLWGRGTPFPDKSSFINKISEGGVAAMELIAKDMKAMGVHLARTISYKGIGYDVVTHDLTNTQEKIYNEIVLGWQTVLNNIDAAMSEEMTGAGNNSQAKARIRSRIWGFQQRFFNRVITSMKMPSIIEKAEQELADGNAVVMQLVNTNEAQLKRALETVGREGTDVADLDLSPKEDLIEMVKKAYPVVQFHETVDEDGNTKWEQRLDPATGEPVINQEAVAARDLLVKNLNDIRIPEAPLEIVLDHFGRERVAEVTGRTNRPLRDPTTGNIEIEPKPANEAEIAEFQKGKKDLLIFSDAGGTGKSYHSDLTNPEEGQKRRYHILVQAGWSAAKAVQGFGRTHRSNQRIPPVLALSTTNLKAEKRFTSSIARRLDQLGALTRGERKTGGQGIFTPEDNLENEYATAAINDLFRAILSGNLEGITEADLKQEMGLDGLKDPITGDIFESRFPPVQRFLNRLLSTSTERMNTYFDEFYTRLEGHVEAARQSGEFDVGVENLVAQKVEKVHEEVVFTDSRSGAETKYIKLELTDPVEYNRFEDIVEMGFNLGRELVFFAQNNQSGQIGAFFSAPPRTMASGTIVDRYRRVGIQGGGKLVNQSDIRTEDVEFGRKANWKRLEAKEAKQIWDESVAAAPTHRTWDEHLITGAVLPVWDRIIGKPRIYRAIADGTERMIGRVIAKRDLVATLNNLNAAGAKVTTTNEQIIDRVLQSDYKYRLSNNWRLSRATINKQRRIELIGPSGFTDSEQLEADGVITEVIDHRTRFFIPTTKKDGAPVLEKLLEFREIADETTPDVVAELSGPYIQRPDANSDTRQMGEELVKENANRAAADAQVGVRTLATAINTEFIETNAADLIGQNIGSASDLATLAQVYRDPRYETLRYFFVDADGNVIAQTGVSARLPGATGSFPDGKGLEWLEGYINRLNPAGIWLLHNHPSGNATPSGPDIALTRGLRAQLRDLGHDLDINHVVIDSNEYSVIRTLVDESEQDSQLAVAVDTEVAIQHRFGEDKLLQAALPSPYLGKRIGGPVDLANIAAAVHKGAGWMTVVGTAGEGGLVRALGEIHESVLATKKGLRVALRQFARDTGSQRLFLVNVRPTKAVRPVKGFEPRVRMWAQRLITEGFVTDVLTNEGISVRQYNTELNPDLLDLQFGFRVADQSAEVREEPSEYETEATQAQAATTRAVRAGQPLDRLLRLPFQLLGLLNNENEFKFGAAGWDRLNNYVRNTRFKSGGAFSWANRVLDHARHGLIDRYGLDKDFIERDAQATADQRRILMQGVEFLNRLFEAGVENLEEGLAVQKMLTGEQIEEREWNALGTEIRQAIDELGMEAVRLGMISRESYERNRGTYLHRVYVKYEALNDESTLSRWLGRAMAGRRHRIKGEALRGRGIFEEITQERLLKDVSKADAEAFFGVKKIPGKPDPVLLTKKFRILDKVEQIGGKVGTLEGIPEGSNPTRLKQRVYWPTDKKLPKGFGGFEDRGVWEVRRIKGGKLVIWRDFTKAERLQMGEILDARYTIARTYHALAKDISSARFFKDIAENPEWTWNQKQPPPEETIAGKDGALRHYIGYEWVLVPDTRVAPKVPAKKWGALAGRYVRAEIWKDLNELDAMNKSGPWNSLLRFWKKNKTARNPVVHANNVMSNLVLMDLIDVRASDLMRGFHSYMNKDEHYVDAAEHQAFGHSFVEQELQKDVLEPILKDMTKEAKQGLYDSSGYLGKIRFANQFARIASEAGSLLKRFDKSMTNGYMYEDEIFRMATYIRKLEQGYSKAEAAALAREQFLNYNIRAPWVNKARRSILPFISYTYRAVPAITEAIMRRPWKLAKYAILAEIANALAYAVTDDDEELERASLRPEVRGDVWIAGVPRMMRAPTNDKHGNPIFLDIRRWIPAGDVFDLHQNQAMPIPAWLQFGGPIMIAGELFLNRAAFTGQDIVNPLTDSLGDKTKKWGEFAYRSVVPSAPWIYDSWYWDRIAGAIAGRRDALMRPTSLPQAVASSLGFKFSSQDVLLNFQYRKREFDRTERALRFTLRQAQRDRTRNIISEGAFSQIQIDTLEKLRRLEENRRETFAPLVNQGQTE